MPNDGFKLPTGEIVRQIYGVRHPGKGTAYLNAVRTTKIDENSLMATEYHGMKRTYAVQLAAEVKRHVPDFDAVISPPSSRPDAEPYRDAVLYGSKARDISQNFSRKGKVKIGHDDTTLEQAIDELVYTADGAESGIKSLLIVDESSASGRTAAAVLHHIREAGLTASCEVTVVVWAKLGE